MILNNIFTQNFLNLIMANIIIALKLNQIYNFAIWLVWQVLIEQNEDKIWKNIKYLMKK